MLSLAEETCLSIYNESNTEHGKKPRSSDCFVVGYNYENSLLHLLRKRIVKVYCMYENPIIE